jgi:hypothetical protein
MREINSAKDFRMICSIAIGLDTAYIYTWVQEHKVPMVQIVVAVIIPAGIAYWRAGIIKGVLPGARGCAELETLAKLPGGGLSITDALSTSHVWFLICLVAGNIVYLRGRRKVK